MLRGEDLPSDGSIYAYGVHDVVAQPGLPATSRALRQVAREEARGAVTALSGVGTQGFVLAAQGQKAVVRGLKEDGTLLPVAFLDLQCHVAALRGLPGCGLALVADAVKGVWFAAFSVSGPRALIAFAPAFSYPSSHYHDALTWNAPHRAC